MAYTSRAPSNCRRSVKAHHLAHQTFTNAAVLDQAIHDAVRDLNRERIPDLLAKPRISATKIASGGLDDPTESPTFSRIMARPRALIGCLARLRGFACG